jgi:hypothetical protein
MSGSASRLYMCRGCKLHFMVRPASLLPLAGLSTSRFGPRGLPRCRRPATRRADAYRDGTCTRWRSAARLVDPQRGFVFAVTAHHGHDPIKTCDHGCGPLPGQRAGLRQASPVRRRSRRTSAVAAAPRRASLVRATPGAPRASEARGAAGPSRRGARRRAAPCPSRRRARRSARARPAQRKRISVQPRIGEVLDHRVGDAPGRRVAGVAPTGFGVAPTGVAPTGLVLESPLESPRPG